MASKGKFLKRASAEIKDRIWYAEFLLLDCIMHSNACLSCNSACSNTDIEKTIMTFGQYPNHLLYFKASDTECNAGLAEQASIADIQIIYSPVLLAISSLSLNGPTGSNFQRGRWFSHVHTWQDIKNK